jgi:hypothetical protein
VKSDVSLDDCLAFVAATTRTTVEVTIENFKGLSQLCREFHFRDLAAQLRKSVLLKISRKTPQLKWQSQ